MTAIRLDLSPMLINRTAAYTLCVDIDRLVRAAGHAVEYQFFGHVAKHMPDQRTAQRWTQEFFGRLGEGLGRRPPQRLFAETEPGRGTATFYVDPLYVLLGELAPHDTVMLLDLSPLTHPHWHDPAVSRAYLAAVEHIIDVQPHLAAISRNTIDTLLANYGGYGRPIRAVPLYPPEPVRQAAADPPAPLHAPWPYFLFVGSLESRKNLTGAIAGFVRSGLAAEGYRLLVVGGRGRGGEEIVEAAGAAEGVVIAGYLTTAELVSAFVGATGFVYPSYLEGFGVPLLEAMMCGVPSVASLTGACPEVGGPDVAYVDPDDHAGIATELRRIAAMPPQERAALGRRLRHRAETEFSFPAFSDAILELVSA
jgi:glycosyltransferase involved in cell wall biosynthesis